MRDRFPRTAPCWIVGLATCFLCAPAGAEELNWQSLSGNPKLAVQPAPHEHLVPAAKRASAGKQVEPSGSDGRATRRSSNSEPQPLGQTDRRGSASAVKREAALPLAAAMKPAARSAERTDQTPPAEAEDGGVGAEEDTAENEEQAVDDLPPSTTNGRPPLRDPTRPSGPLEGVVGSIRMGQQGRNSGGIPGVPNISIKGRIVGPVEPPAAMLEIGENLYVVQEGSSLSLPSEALGPGGLTLSITELTGVQIRIEVMPLRQTIVLR